VKLKDGKAGKRGARWHKITFTLDDFLALKGVNGNNFDVDISGRWYFGGILVEFWISFVYQIKKYFLYAWVSLMLSSRKLNDVQ